MKQVPWKKNGKPIHRITGTIRGKQRCAYRMDATEAYDLAEIWEIERINAQVTIRARATRLNQVQLSEAEALFELCAKLNVSPMAAVLAGIRQTPLVTKKKPFSEALKAYLAEKKETVSSGHFQNIRLVGEKFGASLAPATTLDEITTELIQGFLVRLGELKKRTWNSYRNDLSAFFVWSMARPRAWLPENPVDPIIRYRKRQTATTPERMSVQTCRELMQYLEAEQPHWVCYFAVTLFAGVRPDMTEGEMAKFARKVGTDGAEKYYRGGKFHLSADMTKDGRARRTTVQPNLAAWLEKYPLTAANLNPKSYFQYGKIRARFKIPHDGLRHTCYSAFVAKFDSITEATMQFGNSEGVARDHYIDSMAKDEAEAFFKIVPENNDTATDAGSPPVTTHENDMVCVASSLDSVS